ncbi:MAG: glycine--tRNA ligase subunit beta [Burkholderiales bacterium]
MQATLLVELLTEELPPKILRELGHAFTLGMFRGLSEQGFLPMATDFDVFTTPRRLAVLAPGVFECQPDSVLERKGPSVASAMDRHGNPTNALRGFANSCGVAVEQLERRSDEKGEYFAYTAKRRGETLDAHLSDLVEQVLRKLPVAKLMRWGANEAQFVRPVHQLIMMHGDRIIPGKVLGLQSGNRTLGHRFMGEGEIVIADAGEYADVLEKRGSVIASFSRRKERIRGGLEIGAGEAKILWDEALLDEVTALVEYPAVYSGTFGQEYLSIPQECLVLTMKQHQRYFPLADSTGTLLARFLMVSNLKTDNPGNIIHGNERVLRARLSDAKFFFEQDKRTRLVDRVPKLENVIYHNKLGSQLQRGQRITRLAESIAAGMNANVGLTQRAALLCKADLLTDMVGEFPELQGVMGYYYALHDGEDRVVAEAIKAHYRPRFANDGLPDNPVGQSVALADKLDALVGIFGIGLAPTGDKDPFGLRRHAVGVLRILAECQIPLDLLELLHLAQSQFSAGVLRGSPAFEAWVFVLERLKNYLRERGFEADEIDSVVSQSQPRIDQVVPRLDAVRVFRKLPEAQSLSAANKRIRNILGKTSQPSGSADLALLQESAEKKLFESMIKLTPLIDSYMQNAAYTDALRLLAGIRGQVDTFFDEVMVMTEEPLLRNNRLALLNELAHLMNRVADISKLAA